MSRRRSLLVAACVVLTGAVGCGQADPQGGGETAAGAFDDAEDFTAHDALAAAGTADGAAALSAQPLGRVSDVLRGRAGELSLSRRRQPAQSTSGCAGALPP